MIAAMPPPPLPRALRALPVESVDDYRRPGWITAVGVISICVAAALILFHFFAASLAFTVRIQNQVTRTIFAGPAYAPQAAVTGDIGLPKDEVDAAVDGLTRVRPLSNPRAAAVRRLTKQHGRTMFRFTPITAARVAAGVSDSGQMFDNGGAPADYFVLPEGRLEVDDGAVYRPDGGAALRSGPETEDTGLTAKQAEAFVANVAEQADGTIPPAARDGLKAALQDPKQTLVNATASLEVIDAQLDGTGGLSVTPAAGVYFRTDSNGAVIAVGGAAPVIIPPPPPTGRAHVAAGWLTLMSLLGFAASLLLIAGSIFWLNGRPVARPLMLLFVAISVPLAVATAVALGMTTGALGNFTGGDGEFRWPAAVIAGATLLSWPLIVGVLSFTTPVKVYFAQGARVLR